MFQEYDVVVAKQSLSDVPKGAKGTILIVYDDRKHYEVEFVDDNGNTIAVLTVNETEVEKYS